MSMSRLVVEGHGACEIEPGVSLLDACEANEIPMESDCGGCAACNACRVRVIEGAANLSPKGPEEEPFVDHPDQRLGCQALALGGEVLVRLEPGL